MPDKTPGMQPVFRQAGRAAGTSGPSLSFAEAVEAALAQGAEHGRDVEAARDRGAHRGDVVAGAEQDRADQLAVGDHELAVAAGALVDDRLVGRLGVDAADARRARCRRP